MKKKYRVTTRGKIVFSLAGLLLLYGIMSLLSPKELPQAIDPVSEAPTVQEEVVSAEPSTEPAPLTEDETAAANTDSETDQVVATGEEQVEPVESVTGDNTKTENCTTNKVYTSEDELRLIEAAGFTVYYEPNAYYVPEGDLPLIAEFVAVAKQYPEEEIVIEGNVNKSTGPEEEWDTESVDQLGYTRALVIKNDLIKRGVDKERIVIYNNKDDKPLNVDLSKKSIALNRRVDVFFSQFMYKEIDTK